MISFIHFHCWIVLTCMLGIVEVCYTSLLLNRIHNFLTLLQAFPLQRRPLFPVGGSFSYTNMKYNKVPIPSLPSYSPTPPPPPPSPLFSSFPLFFLFFLTRDRTQLFLRLDRGAACYRIQHDHFPFDYAPCGSDPP